MTFPRQVTMEQCACVERELDRVLQKFLTYGQHCEQSLEELLHYVSQLRAELANAGGCLPTHGRPGATVTKPSKQDGWQW